MARKQATARQQDALKLSCRGPVIQLALGGAEFAENTEEYPLPNGSNAARRAAATVRSAQTLGDKAMAEREKSNRVRPKH